MSGGIPSWLEAKYRSIAMRLNCFLPDKNTPVYDIGCGSGGLLLQLSDCGYKQLYGVDRSAECLNNIALKCSTVEASVYDFTVPATDIPVAVIYSEVFEHLLDPGMAIKKIASSLCEKSIVYVTVPNAARYDKFNYPPLRFLLLEHINHFDAIHLEQLFKISGFRMAECTEKDHDIGEEVPFPMLHAVFEKIQSVNNVLCDRTFALADNADKWFLNKSQQLDNDGRLSGLAKDGKPVYVWGISYRTQMMLAMSPLRDCEIKAFIDNDKRKQSRTIGGRPIVDDAILRTGTIDPSSVVVIGTGPSALKMKMELKENTGFKGKIVLI